jgi:hypothetical protein
MPHDVAVHRLVELTASRDAWTPKARLMIAVSVESLSGGAVRVRHCTASGVSRACSSAVLIARTGASIPG